MHVLINEPLDFPADALAQLRRRGSVHCGDTAYPARLVDAVFVRLRDRIDREFLSRHPRVRWIVSPTTGLNHIDQSACAAAGIQILSLRGRTEFLDRIHATSEHTIALTLALLRHLPQAAWSTCEGRWDRYPFKGGELHGKTVLLVGYGRIGRQVAPLFQAFGASVQAFDIDPARVPGEMRISLEAGLAAADIVSLHVSLDEGTRGMFSRHHLARMKRTAILINTARGELLDQEALLEALERGELAGAALDVLLDEPNPLAGALAARFAALRHRLILTPHIGGFTIESLEAVEKHMTTVFLDQIEGPSGAN